VFNYSHWSPERIEQGEMLKFFEDLQFQARENELTTMLWDAGQFLNRETLEWRDPYIAERLQTEVTSRSGTASFDRIYLEQSRTITDESLTLHRNGLEFEGLWAGEERLEEGTDYTVSGDTLTLTAAALTRLAGDRAYGVNAIVEARFSAGSPWRIYIKSNDQPVLSDATGTTTSFDIPTEFNGDDLATMEARYADGTNAGPATWTPFQEFGNSFIYDYEAGTIILNPAFLDTLREGEPATLTFHWWGSDTVTFTVARTGTTVTGTAT
jgi:hypothetical protein